MNILLLTVYNIITKKSPQYELALTRISLKPKRNKAGFINVVSNWSEILANIYSGVELRYEWLGPRRGRPQVGQLMS